ncbi:hypothetical protein [Shewanella septentrionalis]|uniref:Uncharacterized protein n=1 Tax=Shewanella septentrionalis TaxID=2952223 RepID=A0A9X3AW25_9GAMM|nr:hypothetical protein [Shewanella septentrionalis]MCT7947821.1 hypothetical protein [Shewanella septentrionalis]
MYIERHCLPSTTYGAADVVKEKIKAAKGIKSILFGARDAVANRYATSILLIATTPQSFQPVPSVLIRY